MPKGISPIIGGADIGRPTQMLCALYCSTILSGQASQPIDQLSLSFLTRAYAVLCPRKKTFLRIDHMQLPSLSTCCRSYKEAER